MLKFNPLNRNRSANTKMKSPGFAQPLSSNNGGRGGGFQVGNAGSTNEHVRNVLESPKFRPDLLSKNDNPPEIVPPTLVK